MPIRITGRHFLSSKRVAVLLLASVAMVLNVHMSASAATQASWTSIFDGSDHDLAAKTEDVDALHTDDGVVFTISTAGVATVSGNTWQDKDVFSYDPIGDAWTLEAAGSTHALTTNAEDIDALSYLADGSYIISTRGNFNINGLQGRDEDLVKYDIGSNSWSIMFDGSAEGLPGNADVDAAHVISETDFLVSFNVDSINLPGIGLVNDEDIVRFTDGAWSMYFDGSLYDLSTNGEDIDAIVLQDDGSLLISTVGVARVTGISGKVADEDIMRFEFPDSPPADPITFALLGDSITRGYLPDNPVPWRIAIQNPMIAANCSYDFLGNSTGDDEFNLYGAGFDDDNDGNWSARTSHAFVQNLGYSTIVDNQVDVALIFLGTNNINVQSPSAAFNELETWVDNSRSASPNTEFFVAQITPHDSGYDFTGGDTLANIQAYNQLIADYAAITPNVTAVDMYTGYDYVADHRDGIHPTQAGAQKIADQWVNALRSSGVMDGNCSL